LPKAKPFGATHGPIVRAVAVVTTIVKAAFASITANGVVIIIISRTRKERAAIGRVSSDRGSIRANLSVQGTDHMITRRSLFITSLGRQHVWTTSHHSANGAALDVAGTIVATVKEPSGTKFAINFTWCKRTTVLGVSSDRGPIRANLRVQGAYHMITRRSLFITSLGRQHVWTTSHHSANGAALDVAGTMVAAVKEPSGTNLAINFTWSERTAVVGVSADK
jgi:hypothetical protein